MKILSTSDLHRDKAAALTIVAASVDADVVVCAGDFATKGVGGIQVLEVLAKCQAPVIVVHGNHDTPAEVEQFCTQSPNLHYLHGTGLTLGKTVFFGLGGEIPSRNNFPWNAAETEGRAAQLLTNCPDGAVLVTHTPPLGTADLQRDGSHEGSIAIRDAATRTRLKLLLCGHIHNAWGMSGQIGTTPVHNLGPGVNWFEI